VEELFEGYAAANPELAAEFERTQKGVRKAGWEKAIPSFAAGKPVATRNAGGAVMNAIADVVPELFGGAADLTSSTKTIFKPGASFHVDPAGRNVFFGVREFGMCAAVNGMAAHGGLIPFGSTFLCSPITASRRSAPRRADEGAFAVCLYARLDCPG
jgi:transketolase